MDEAIEDIELDENFKPKRNPLLLFVFDTLLPYFIMPLAVFSSAVSLSIIFKGMNFFFHSFAGWPVSLLLMTALWLFSLPIALVSWKFSFFNSLFCLLPFNEFRAGQALILIAVFASKMLFITLRHGNLNYRARLGIFIACCVLVTFNLIITATHAAASGRIAQFCYVYAVEFILFVAMTAYEFGKPKEDKGKPEKEEDQDV
ncbi:MAG: hypothetical protein Q8L26_08430 [Candidatus Omnitrophota bacterium]|nr:hypothetical protein [Candidatus Omnitrophota bacterium]